MACSLPLRVVIVLAAAGTGLLRYPLSLSNDASGFYPFHTTTKTRLILDPGINDRIRVYSTSRFLFPRISARRLKYLTIDALAFRPRWRCCAQCFE